MWNKKVIRNEIWSPQRYLRKHHTFVPYRRSAYFIATRNPEYITYATTENKIKKLFVSSTGGNKDYVLKAVCTEGDQVRVKSRRRRSGPNITPNKLKRRAVTFPQSRFLHVAIVPILHGHKLTLCVWASVRIIYVNTLCSFSDGEKFYYDYLHVCTKLPNVNNNISDLEILLLLCLMLKYWTFYAGTQAIFQVRELSF